jgi:radical SAM superfamily enzyme YgiQ (UPF0313 family)
MKVTLIRVIEFFQTNQVSHPRDVIPSFELLNIAAFLENKKLHYQHFDNEVLHLNFTSFQKMVTQKKSDIYIIHFQPLVNQEIIDLIKKLKSRNQQCIVVVFGPTVDNQTELFLKNSKANVAIFGEAEQSTFELIELFEKQQNNYLKQITQLQIAGTALIYKKSFIQNKSRALMNPDNLPFMAHHLLYENANARNVYQVTSKVVFVKEKIKWGFILSSRGCPFHCTFCSPSIRNSYGKKYRFQSPQRTVNEIEYLIKNFHVNAISFEDDLFTLNKKRVIDLCKALIKRRINVSWTVATRLDSLDTRVLQWMKKAGCRGMSVGVESGSDRILALVKKGERIKDLEKGIALLKKFKIAVTINLIIGHKNETLEEMQRTLVLAKKLKPVFIHLHYLTPYPGTKIFTEYQKELTNFKDFSHWKTHSFNISNVSNQELQNMMKHMYKSYYCSFDYITTYFKYRYQYYFYNLNFELTFMLNNLKYLFLQK